MSSVLPVIARRIRIYQTCPFARDSVPGGVFQQILSATRGDRVLDTYDFVDNISSCGKIGWQVKSTKEDTPVTWKRAKIPNKQALIAESRSGPEGCQKLGDAIIAFCNKHAQESISKYGLRELRLCRLIVMNDGTALIYERHLCSRESPQIFDTGQLVWSWSSQRSSKSGSKEQLTALHGHDRTGVKCWAWHGLGENQLHFAGERAWWPTASGESPSHIRFRMPVDTERLPWDRFTDALAVV